MCWTTSCGRAAAYHVHVGSVRSTASVRGHIPGAETRWSFGREHKLIESGQGGGEEKRWFRHGTKSWHTERFDCNEDVHDDTGKQDDEALS